ncbi:MAG: hypothetical protein K2K76_01550 [Muribaculaceae bacterium]|nr:hypothetical protein [Muribaculaceae bacterium]
MRIVIDKLKLSIKKDDALQRLIDRITEAHNTNDMPFPHSEPIIEYGKTFLKEKPDAHRSHFKYNYDVYVNFLKIGYFEITTYGVADRFAYFILYNNVLYNDSWKLYKQAIAEIGLQISHISKLDIALDTHINLTERYISIVTDRTNELVALGNIVKDEDRSKYVEHQMFICGGSYDEPLKVKSLYLHTHDKTLSMRVYDKTQEIEKSGKTYADLPATQKNAKGHFYRCEISLSAKQINRHEKKNPNLLTDIENKQVLAILHRKYMFKLFRYTPHGASKRNKKRLTLL